MGKLKLRAARTGDRLRIEGLWRDAFPDGLRAEHFLEQYFVPDHVESSLVLLEDGVLESMVFFLPTFWYDGTTDDFAPAPCLMGLTTNRKRRGLGYAGWLVETACDFLVEKGAGAVWTVLPDDGLETFFAMQGFWTLPKTECFSVERASLPPVSGRICRAEPEEYDQVREALLRGKSHVVAGEVFSAFQRDSAEHAGGGMFLAETGSGAGCVIAARQGDAVEIRELLCSAEARPAVLALLAEELPGARYTMEAQSRTCGMLRLMNRFARLEKPAGYLGCGPL